MRVLLLITLSASAMNASAAERIYRFDLVNSAPNPIKTFAVAAALGGEIYREINLHGQWLPAGESVTIVTRKSEGGCLRNLRTVFGNGEVRIERNFDVCRCASFDAGRVEKKCEQASVSMQP
ncbi:MAG: hypothetical protein E6K53_05905 [Gammaproteobacteria bacterium]|nr:MAG: hypothetical protein E6K53_05905 [Gammaproteobacteria bacterium]